MIRPASPSQGIGAAHLLGVLIAEGAAQMASAPWLPNFPATFLAITLFCFNFIGP
jgi:ABC-type dipeptide/oligopeptide/nickel transport system permease subunit